MTWQTSTDFSVDLELGLPYFSVFRSNHQIFFFFSVKLVPTSCFFTSHCCLTTALIISCFNPVFFRLSPLVTGGFTNFIGAIVAASDYLNSVIPLFRRVLNSTLYCACAHLLSKIKTSNFQPNYKTIPNINMPLKKNDKNI